MNVSLDLRIHSTYSTQTLAVGDVSVYPGNYVITNPTLEITPPSLNKAVVAFSPKNLNIYNSNDLNIICSGDVDLPDGIWELKYSIAPSHVYFVEKKFIKVDLILRDYQMAFLKTDLSNCDISISSADKQALQNIYNYIIGAVAAANDCDYVKAMEFYNVAKNKLDKFNKTKC
jgi:hypothetical protein